MASSHACMRQVPLREHRQPFLAADGSSRRLSVQQETNCAIAVHECVMDEASNEALPR